MPERIEALHRTFRLLVACNVLLLLAALGVGVYAYYQAQQATAGLCALRSDRTDQIAASDRFLRKHPHGIPGIPASLIRQSRATAQRTVDALSFLNC
jgi:hypothetical protein